MSSPKNGVVGRGLPCLEPLEDRLLLTTLLIPDDGSEQFFIYHSSQDVNVRVNLTGAPGDAVELLGALRPPGSSEITVVDLVGIRNGDLGDIISWPGWSPLAIVNLTADPPAWADRDEVTNPLGSMTELFAIYVAQCSAQTVLTISALGSNALASDDGTHFTNLTTWAAEVPILFAAGDEDIGPPDQSGGVIVGAIPQPSGDDEDRHVATVDPIDGVNEIGLYPGTGVAGPLMPGITIDPANAEMGKIFVAGTLSGALQFGTVDLAVGSTGGDLNAIYLGFLWGNITVGGNVNSIILTQGGGGMVYGEEQFRTPWGGSRSSNAPWSTISVGKSLDFFDRRGPVDGILYSAVLVGNDPSMSTDSTLSYELEYATGLDPDDEYLDWLWRTGNLVDYDNNSQATAQFLNHPSGTFMLSGQLGEENDNFTDWYALPLMAGQTVMIGGNIPSYLAAYLYDSELRWLDSFGYETIEDQGLGSRGSTLEPIRFTAPSAGVYYLNVTNAFDYAPGWGSYQLSVTNGPANALGGVSITGNYEELRSSSPSVPYTIQSLYGGGIGGVVVGGVSVSVNVLADHGGDLVAFQAASIGWIDPDTGYLGGRNRLYASGSIGGVRSTGVGADGFVYADIEAGLNGATRDARICNVSAATYLTYGSTLWASGSIGIIDVGLDLGSDGSVIGDVDIRANTDSRGPAGHIDLIRVGGAYYVPSIRTGSGGDIGYIHVSGDVYTNQAGNYHLLAPTVVTDGRTTVLSDDNGGTLTLSPRVIGTDVFTGRAIYATYSYLVLSSGLAAGSGTGVLSRLSIVGPMDITCSGTNSAYQITDLTVAGLGADNLTLGGTGMTSVYSLTASGINTLTLYGNLVYGALAGDVASVTIKSVAGKGGSIGELDDTSTGAWLYGSNAAPAASGTTEPQYGLIRGTLEGLHVTGSLALLRVDGSLGDFSASDRLGTVVVNADGVTRAGKWDGVRGVVYAASRIEEIRVGDGLADDGGAEAPKAGIFCGGSIGLVSISGPRREVARSQSNINEYLKGKMVFGELNGCIIGLSNTFEGPGVGQVVGTNGAVLTALVLGMQLNSFQCFLDSYVMTSDVGTISFSGPGAAVTGMEVGCRSLGRVWTSADSQGISSSRFRAVSGGIGEIIGGGPGIRDSAMTTNGENIGSVRGLGAAADIIRCEISSTDGMGTLSGRDIAQTTLYMPGTLATLTATRNIDGSLIGTQDNPLGAVTMVTVAGSIIDSEFHVARSVRTVNVRGAFTDSTLSIEGGNEGVLQSLTVYGNISGRISSSGRIGSIISTTGLISADIATVADGWSAGTGRWNVALIQTARGYTGGLSVAGSLLRFISAVSLGESPETSHNGRSQVFYIQEGLTSLRVGNGRSVAHLYASLNVGGDIGTMDVDGTLYGAVTTNGNIRSLTLDGGLGGQLDSDHDGVPEDFGSLNVFGSITTMRFNRSADVVADIRVGGSISSLSLVNASIRGDVISRFGTISSISVVNGSILGKIMARSIGTVTVTGGSIVGEGLETTANGIRSLTITGGTLDADIAAAGTIDVLNIVGSAVAGRTISGARGLGTLRIGGNLDADVTSGRDITSLTVGGALRGAVNAERALKTLLVTGDLSGTVRAGGGIGRLTAGSLTGATISSAWNIGDVRVKGTAANSFVLAGYDAGADGVVGGGDDHPITGSVHSGNITSVTIGGALNRTIVAAGVDPGMLFWGAYTGFMITGDNVDAPGISSIGKMTVAGGFGTGANRSAVLADTRIDPVFLAAAGSQVETDSGVSVSLSGGGTDFGPAVGTPSLVIGGLTLTLTGDGRANYNPATSALVLERTSSRSVLRIANTGPAQAIHIFGSDDSELSSLTVTGDVTLRSLQIDGVVGTLTVGAVFPGASWRLPGGVRTATVAAPGSAAIQVGEAGTWTLRGPFSGSLTFDAIRTLTAAGVSGPIVVKLGDAGTIRMGGAFSGSATIRGSVNSLTVAGAMTGHVDVTHGDLLSIQATSLGGVVAVPRGLTRTARASAGSFTGSFRTEGGVGSFTVSGGSFSGLLSTDGDLTTLQVSGDFSGRVRAGGAIRRAAVGSLTRGLLAAGGGLDSVTITRSMLGGWIFSGFDPGDAGYVPGEAGNVAIGGTGAQADTPRGGSIRSVTVGGDMGRSGAVYAGSTISAAVAPGADGYCGTFDDQVRGTGTMGRVTVRGQIYGTGDASACFGVFAASGLPRAYFLGSQPFEFESNTTTGSLADAAGPPSIRGLAMTFNSLVFEFSHGIDMSSVQLGSTLTFLLSTDAVFNPAVDTDLSIILTDPAWDPNDLTVTVTLIGTTWDQLAHSGLGTYLQVTLDGTTADVDGDGAVMDRRGNVVDGEFHGTYPSGDGLAGGGLVYVALLGDLSDTFVGAVGAGLFAVPVDGGTVVFGQSVDSSIDVDIFGFAGTLYDYVGITYTGSTDEQVKMCLFYRDTQGTAGVADDSFEAVARWESDQYSGLRTLAYELPAIGEYYLAVAWDYAPTSSYQIGITIASTDVNLIAGLGGALPDGVEIGYVSNTIGAHRNALGANNPKQLVYLDFDGGTATQGNYAPYSEVSAFDLSEIDPSLAGRDSEIIHGSAGVTGIIDNMISIYSNTPASYPGGALTVRYIDPTNAADWAAYLAAPSGLWFTTVDPATARGLDPTRDFTTVFFGNAGIGREYGDPLGLASGIDVMNLSKADNAVVFAPNFQGYATGATELARMNQYSRALANIAAHELGHTLGLNHQPTTGSSRLVADDPDNNPATADDSNRDYGLMGYSSASVYTGELLELGTARLTTGEFPVGSSDTVDLLMRWLA